MEKYSFRSGGFGAPLMNKGPRHWQGIYTDQSEEIWCICNPVAWRVSCPNQATWGRAFDSREPCAEKA